jgi:hypothetical protein
LFINPSKVEHISEYLSENNIFVENYEAVGDFLSSINETITIDENELNYFLYQK